MLRNYKLSLLLAGIILIVLTACKVLSSSTTEDSTPIANKNNQLTEINYDGNWSGITSQNKSIKFSIVENSIDSISYHVTLLKSNCIYDNFGYYDPTINIPISNKIFVANHNNYDLSQSTFATITGEFDSSISTSGTISFEVEGACNDKIELTWSAKKMEQ